MPLINMCNNYDFRSWKFHKIVEITVAEDIFLRVWQSFWHSELIVRDIIEHGEYVTLMLRKLLTFPTLFDEADFLHSTRKIWRY